MSNPAVDDAQPGTVTAVVLCYQHERWVLECLESIRRQSVPPSQLIVADDASTDRSPALIEAWCADHWPDATLLLHEQNLGVCRTLNEALTAATGDYLAMIGSDDLMHNDRLRAQAAALDAAGDDVAFVYSPVRLIDEESQDLGKVFPSATPEPADGDLFVSLMRESFIPAPGTMYRRRAIEAVGPYDPSLPYEDWDMLLRLTDRFQAAYLPVEVADYRQVTGSISRRMSSPEFYETRIQVLRKHVDGRGRDVALARIWQHAEWMYKAGMPGAARYLRYVARHQPTPRRLLLAGAATVRVPPQRMASATLLLGTRRHRP